MTAHQFHTALATLHWSVMGVAKILGRPEGTVRRWANGSARVPDDVAAWLHRRAAAAAAHPPPRRVA